MSAEEEGVRESRHEPESEEEMSSMRRFAAKWKGTAHDVELTGLHSDQQLLKQELKSVV